MCQSLICWPSPNRRQCVSDAPSGLRNDAAFQSMHAGVDAAAGCTGSEAVRTRALALLVLHWFQVGLVCWLTQRVGQRVALTRILDANPIYDLQRVTSVDKNLTAQEFSHGLSIDQVFQPLPPR